jgi:hypothetical protein
MIHAYKMNGYNIILDANSGSVHAVDELAYDVISLYESMSKDEITRLMLEKYRGRPDVSGAEIGDVFSDVEELIAQGKLFSADVFKTVALKSIVQSSKRSVCTLPTTATSAADIVLRARENTRGARPHEL